MQRDYSRNELQKSHRNAERMLCLCSRSASGVMKRRLLSRTKAALTELSLQQELRLLVLSSVFNINPLRDADYLLKFRVSKKHIGNIARVIQWNSGNSNVVRTEQRRYISDPIQAICIILRRLSTPCRCNDHERESERHSYSLAEMFYNTVNSFYSSIWKRCPKLEIFFLGFSSSALFISNCAKGRKHVTLYRVHRWHQSLD